MATGSLEAVAAKASSVASSLAMIPPASAGLRRSTSLSHDGQAESIIPGARRAGSVSSEQHHPNARLPPNGSSYSRVSTHHVIPVSAGSRQQQPALGTGIKTQLSPDGEIYGFGKQFKEGSRQYFSADMPTATPQSYYNPYTSAHGQQQQQQHTPTTACSISEEALQNQRFLDSLSAKLTGSVGAHRISACSGHSDSSYSTLTSRPDPPAFGNGNSVLPHNSAAYKSEMNGLYRGENKRDRTDFNF